MLPCLGLAATISEEILKSKHNYQVVADVWEKDVWDFQAKSGSSGSCRLFLQFLGRSAVQEMSGKTPGSPRHPSSRHLQPSEIRYFRIKGCSWMGVGLEALDRSGEKVKSIAFWVIAFL